MEALFPGPLGAGALDGEREILAGFALEDFDEGRLAVDNLVVGNPAADSLVGDSVADEIVAERLVVGCLVGRHVAGSLVEELVCIWDPPVLVKWAPVCSRRVGWSYRTTSSRWRSKRACLTRLPA